MRDLGAEEDSRWHCYVVKYGCLAFPARSHRLDLRVLMAHDGPCGVCRCKTRHRQPLRRVRRIRRDSGREGESANKSATKKTKDRLCARRCWRKLVVVGEQEESRKGKNDEDEGEPQSRVRGPVRS